MAPFSATIEASANANMVHLEAVMNERCALHLQEKWENTEMQAYMTKAVQCYHTWGAYAKVTISNKNIHSSMLTNWSFLFRCQLPAHWKHRCGFLISSPSQEEWCRVVESSCNQCAWNWNPTGTGHRSHLLCTLATYQPFITITKESKLGVGVDLFTFSRDLLR